MESFSQVPREMFAGLDGVRDLANVAESADARVGFCGSMLRIEIRGGPTTIGTDLESIGWAVDSRG